jgi:hypothetical protein
MQEFDLIVIATHLDTGGGRSITYNAHPYTHPYTAYFLNWLLGFPFA